MKEYEWICTILFPIVAISSLRGSGLEVASEMTELKQLENVQLQLSPDPASSQTLSLQGGGMCSVAHYNSQMFLDSLGPNGLLWLKSKSFYSFTVVLFPDF